MWVHSGDKFKIKSEVCEVVEIFGLYSSGPNVTVVLKNQKNDVIKYSLLDFNTKFNKNEIEAVMIKAKPRGI